MWAVVGLVVLAACTPARHTGRPKPDFTPLTVPNTSSAGSADASQVVFLRELAARTWTFFSSDLDPTTHLPRNNVVANGPTTHGDFTSPTEIGLFLSAMVAAKDLGLASADQLTQLAGQELTTLESLQTYRGFLLRWYKASTGQAIGGPTGKPLTDLFVSTVDDAWYAQGLMLARDAFASLRVRYSKLLSAMNFSLLFDKANNQLYTGYHVAAHAADTGAPSDTTDAGEPSTGDYKLLYGGTRIADFMAVGTSTVPGSLMWGLQTVPSTSAQRQQPQLVTRTLQDPQTRATEHPTVGIYTYQGIKFVPTFAGSMFQALAPALVIPEAAQSPSGLGVNDRNTVLAQIKYAATAGYPVWGLAPASTPQRLNGYMQYGAPDLATKPGSIPHTAVTPYASALALPFEPALAADNLQTLARDFPSSYTDRGFLDSVDPASGRVAGRYMAVSQAVILMSIDDALNADALAKYVANDSVGKVLAPYLAAQVFPLT